MPMSKGGTVRHAQRTTHQLLSDIEDNNDEGNDQECAASEDKRRRLMNKSKLGWEVGKAERGTVRRRRGNRRIRNDGHGVQIWL